MARYLATYPAVQSALRVMSMAMGLIKISNKFQINFRYKKEFVTKLFFINYETNQIGVIK